MVAALQLYTIVVQYDLNLAGPYCNQIALLNRGKIVAAGPPPPPPVVVVPENLEPPYELNVGRDGIPRRPFTPRIP